MRGRFLVQDPAPRSSPPPSTKRASGDPTSDLTSLVHHAAASAPPPPPPLDRGWSLLSPGSTGRGSFSRSASEYSRLILDLQCPFKELLCPQASTTCDCAPSSVGAKDLVPQSPLLADGVKQYMGGWQSRMGSTHRNIIYRSVQSVTGGRFRHQSIAMEIGDHPVGKWLLSFGNWA